MKLFVNLKIDLIFFSPFQKCKLWWLIHLLQSIFIINYSKKIDEKVEKKIIEVKYW